MNLEERRMFCDKYENFYHELMLEFEDADTCSEEHYNELIARFMHNYRNDPETIQDAITEGKEVLNLKPFPWRILNSIQHCGPHNSEVGELPEEERYHKWVSWIISRVEEEAKKRGII